MEIPKATFFLFSPLQCIVHSLCSTHAQHPAYCYEYQPTLICFVCLIQSVPRLTQILGLSPCKCMVCNHHGKLHSGEHSSGATNRNKCRRFPEFGITVSGGQSADASCLKMYSFDRRRVNGPGSSHPPVYEPSVEVAPSTQRKGRRPHNVRPICV